MEKLLLMAALASIAFLTSAEPGVSSPVGNWLAKDGWVIRIGACGRNMCGFIVKASPPNDPETNRPWTDKFNPDPGKRSRSAIGVQTIISMKPDGPKKWTGKLYNVDDGKTYPGNLIEVDRSTVRVEGCSLGICGGEELSRFK
jgi:uncharacterized protein (DUF2147 family)